MAKVASKVADFTYNSVALEGYADTIEQRVIQELPEVTALSDGGPRRVVDNYDFEYNLEGANDYASGAVDATLFAQIGGSGAAVDFEPTGANAGANDPNYTPDTVYVESYTISIKRKQGQRFSAVLKGGAALDRDVA